MAKRIPLALLAMLSLAAGVWMGLERLGLVAGALPASLHGPLMISGFLGTLIGLERAAGLPKHPWVLIAPASSGAGCLLMALGHEQGLLLVCASGPVLLAAYGVLFRVQAAPFIALMAVGAACWTAGSVMLLLGVALPLVVPWWTAFPLLTIIGERLQLSRLVGTSRAWTWALWACVAVSLVGAACGSYRVYGVSLVALAVWLARNDLARRTFHLPDLPGYVGRCLLAGYAWLGVGGALMAAFSDRMIAGPWYDAALHAVFVGFVFSMIFAHAPMMLPAMTGAVVSFSWRLYVPLAVLHLSLALRVGGDLLAVPAARAAGGALNAVSLLLFAAVMATSVRRR